MNRYVDWLRNEHIRALVTNTGGSDLNAKSFGHLVLELIVNVTGLHCELVSNDSTNSTGSVNLTTNVWSGLLSLLVNDTADAALTLVSETPERSAAFDFVPSISHTQYNLLISKRQLLPGNQQYFVSLYRLGRQLNEMFNPFSSKVWLAILTTILLLALLSSAYAVFPIALLPSKVRSVARPRFLTFSAAKIGHEIFYNLLGPMFFPSGSTTKSIPAEIRAICHDQRISYSNSPVVVMFFTWSLCCFLVTTFFVANVEMHSAIDAPPPQPFDSIASFAKARYFLLLERHTSNEQRIRGLARDLRGTRDGEILQGIIQRSEPFWNENYTILAATMRGELHSDKKFAFLTSTRGRDIVQDESCNFQAAEFRFQHPGRASSTADEPLSMALQKNSRFVKPLTHMVSVLKQFGLLRALEGKEWQYRAENKRWLNEDKFKCVERTQKNAVFRRNWVKMGMWQVHPIFEVLVLLLTSSVIVFGLELVWARGFCVTDRNY